VAKGGPVAAGNPSVLNAKLQSRPDTGTRSPTLSRSLSLWLATLYGLGVTIGAGIYVLIGAAAARAGMHAPLAFVAAAGLMALSAASFAELACRLPVAAGEAAYARADRTGQAHPSTRPGADAEDRGGGHGRPSERSAAGRPRAAAFQGRPHDAAEDRSALTAAAPRLDASRMSNGQRTLPRSAVWHPPRTCIRRHARS
jgi:hypothetical protein